MIHCGQGLTTLLPDSIKNNNPPPGFEPGITVGPVSGVPTEPGGTASFSLVLNSRPVADVTILISSTVISSGEADPNSIIFTPDNWNVTQYVAVKGKDEPEYDEDRVFEIYFPDIISEDPDYSILTLESMAFTTKSRGTPGISIVYNTALQTSESGQTASFDVLLDTGPLSNVTIFIESDNEGYGIATPSQLVFTPENYSIRQTVTVSGIDDNIPSALDRHFNLYFSIQTTDVYYSVLSPPDEILFTIKSRDSAGVTISDYNALETSETGQTDNFVVVLNTIPSSNVTINIESDNTTAGTVSPLSLLFTPSNWNVLQTVILSAVDDNLPSAADRSFNVNFSITSEDVYYSTLIPPQPVPVTVKSKEIAGITVVKDADLQTSESGESISYEMVLNTIPLSDVTILIQSQDATEGIASPSQIVFTSSNWNVPRTVTVTGVPDDDPDGDVEYHVTAGVATSDSYYSSINIDPVVITNIAEFITTPAPIGSDSISVGAVIPTASMMSMYVYNDNGTPVPYLFIRDEGTSPAGKGSVLRYISGSWEFVGERGFTSGTVGYSVDQDSLSIYVYHDPINNQPVPYIAYCDVSNGNKAAVKRYNGTSWQDVGSNPSSGGSRFFSLQIWDDGTQYGIPYVSFNEYYLLYYHAYVKTYSGGAWTNVGSEITDNTSTNTSLQIYKNGSIQELYIAYVYSNTFIIISGVPTLSVKKWNGSSWSNVGTTDIDSNSSGSGAVLSLAHGVTGPVVYAGWNNNGIKIFRLNGSSWQTVTAPLSGSVSNLSLSLYPDNTNNGILYSSFINSGGNVCLYMMDGNWSSLITTTLTGSRPDLFIFDDGSGYGIPYLGIIRSDSTTGVVQIQR